MRKPWFRVVPPVSGCAFGVAPTAAGEYDELEAAEQGGLGLGIERESGRDEVVDPAIAISRSAGAHIGLSPGAEVRARGPDAQSLTSMARWRWSAPAAP